MQTPRGRPVASLAEPAARALDRNAGLAQLLQRVRESERRWDAARPLLPAALAAAVRPGPLDDQAWVLLADNASAAAKLRQCLPTLDAALQQQGWPALPLRVRILPRA